MYFIKIKKRIQKIAVINNIYTRFKWRERKISLGNENENQVFYIVRRANAKVGLFSIVLTSLGYIKYALEQEYVPVVDMQNYNYALRGDIGTQNMWEYYFEQPCGFGLQEIGKSKNIIKGNGIILDSIEYPDAQIAYDDTKIVYWRRFAKQYLRVRNDILKEAEALKKQLFLDNRILGVLARGTDYVNAKPVNHPVQPTPEQLMQKIDEVMLQRKCSKIFLATEDQSVYEKFRNKYGDALITMDVQRYETKGKQNINEIRKMQEKDDYSITKDYLIAMLLLAQCNCLVAGNTSGTIGTLLLSDGYEYKYIFNLGFYGKKESTNE